MASLCLCWEETDGVALSPGILAEAVGSWDPKSSLPHSSPAREMSTCSGPSILTWTLSSWVSFSRCQSQHGCLDCHCHLQDSLAVFLFSVDIIPGYMSRRSTVLVVMCQRRLVLTHRSVSHRSVSWSWRLEWSQPHSGCCCDQEHGFLLCTFDVRKPHAVIHTPEPEQVGSPTTGRQEQVPHLYYSVCLEVHAHLHMQQEVTNPSSHYWGPVAESS